MKQKKKKTTKTKAPSKPLRGLLIGAAPTPTAWIKRALASLSPETVDVVIGVDGGAEVALAVGLKPDVAVGDWDSLGSKESIEGIPQIGLHPDKDRSDLYCAMLVAIEAGCEYIDCIGMSGGRIDHEMSVIWDLAGFMADPSSKLKGIRVFGPESELHFVGPGSVGWSAEVRKGQVISLFAPLGPVSGLKLKGLKFARVAGALKPSSHGLSNRAIDERVSITLKKGVLLAALPRERRKRGGLRIEEE